MQFICVYLFALMLYLFSIWNNETVLKKAFAFSTFDELKKTLISLTENSNRMNRVKADANLKLLLGNARQ